MYAVILEVLVKFVGLLKDGGVLASSSKRKQLGRSLVDLYQILDRLAKNAEMIKLYLDELVMKDPSKNGFELKSLHHHLKMQQHELTNLQSVFSKRSTDVFMDVYGGNILDPLRDIQADKSTLIHVYASLVQQQPNSLTIPNDNAIGPDARKQWFEFVLAHPPRPLSSLTDIAMTEISLDAPIEKALPVLANFHKRITEMQAAETFSKCHESLGNLIREHFKVEELI